MRLQFCVSLPRTRFATLRDYMLGRLGVESKPIWLRGLMDKTAAEKTALAKCRNYCKMDADKPGKGGVVYKESRILIGLDAAPSKQGKRNDLVAFRSLVKEKKGVIDLMDEEIIGEPELKTIARFPNFVAKLQARVMVKEDKQKPVAFAFTGPSGTGKTYKAWELIAKLGLRKDQVFEKDPDTQWWDGFDPSQHRCVLVDEYRGAQTGMWLKILNEQGSVFFCQQKGTSVPVTAQFFIFTSPTHPLSWIQSWDHQDHGEQWVRRFGPRHKVLEEVHAGAAQVAPEYDALFASLF